MKSQINKSLNRATKSRRLTAIKKSEELLLLRVAQALLELCDVYYPAQATAQVLALRSALELYRQGMLVFDDIDIGVEDDA